MSKQLAATMGFRVTPELKREIEAAAKRAGLRPGDFLRRKVEAMFASALADLPCVESRPQQEPWFDERRRPEIRLAVQDFARDIDDSVNRLLEEDIAILLIRGERAVAEVLPIYHDPPAHLANALEWEAEDAWEPLGIEWDALR